MYYFLLPNVEKKTAECELLDCETLKYVCKMRSVELVPGKMFSVEKPRKQFSNANKNLGHNDAPVLIMASDQSAQMSLAKRITICFSYQLPYCN